MAFVRRRAYEIFQKLHLFLAAMLITAIYLHSPSKQLFTSPVVYLFAAVCLQICTAFFRISQVLYRNIRYGKPPSRATVRTITYKTRERDIPISDAVQVHIRPLQPWKPRAGQYVYLSIRGVSHTSLMQSHPFSVAWWYRDTEGDAIVLIVEKRKGFTEDLFSHTSTDIGPQSGMQATVEGPYGKELDLESYGTVLLFATGMGIAAQLPYVTRLLEGYHNRKLKSRRIALFWELESECKLSLTPMKVPC
jgi:predicted ferric reductase